MGTTFRSLTLICFATVKQFEITNANIVLVSGNFNFVIYEFDQKYQFSIFIFMR